jgi:hypothetical protein
MSMLDPHFLYSPPGRQAGRQAGRKEGNFIFPTLQVVHDIDRCLHAYKLQLQQAAHQTCSKRPRRSAAEKLMVVRFSWAPCVSDETIFHLNGIVNRQLQSLE